MQTNIHWWSDCLAMTSTCSIWIAYSHGSSLTRRVRLTERISALRNSLRLHLQRVTMRKNMMICMDDGSISFKFSNNLEMMIPRTSPLAACFCASIKVASNLTHQVIPVHNTRIIVYLLVIFLQPCNTLIQRLD